MKVELFYESRVAVLRCTGSLGEPERTDFVRFATQLAAYSPRHLLTDWRGVTDMEACAFAGFADLANLFLSNGGEVAVLGLAPDLQKPLHAAGLEPVFRWFTDEAAARKFLRFA